VADLLYFGRTFGVKKSTKNSKILLHPVFELQVASFHVNCTSGFKFGRRCRFQAILRHSYLKKFPLGALFYSMTDRGYHLLRLFYSIFRTEKEQFWGVDLLYRRPIQKAVTGGLSHPYSPQGGHPGTKRRPEDTRKTRLGLRNLPHSFVVTVSNESCGHDENMVMSSSFFWHSSFVHSWKSGTHLR
jgi:hypothetical protein